MLIKTSQVKYENDKVKGKNPYQSNKGFKEVNATEKESKEESKDQPKFTYSRFLKYPKIILEELLQNNLIQLLANQEESEYDKKNL